MLTEYEIKNVSALNEITEVISNKAKELGLDFYPTIFEVVPANTLYTFGAYTMPTRYGHWSFGKGYFKMKTMYEHGFIKIYEMVINTNPCYAFLVEDNTATQNMLIISHVLAHNDFFKNNRTFKKTRRDMVESMAASANRIREYERKYGRDEVEVLLDAAHSIANHIDFYDVTISEVKETETVRRTPYDDIWELNSREVRCRSEYKKNTQKKTPPSSEFDILRFIINHSHSLEEWKKDILTIVRDEAYYFYPQMETHMMNEGWATFWHKRIMNNLDLKFDQVVDFAKMHAGVVAPNPHKINPYYVGSAIFEDILERWNNPSEEDKKKGIVPNSGLEKIFEVRAGETDASFIRNYLTKELVEKLDLYLYQRTDEHPDAKKGPPQPWAPVLGNKEYWVVSEKEEWEKIRDHISFHCTHKGIPTISVEEINDNNELVLKHHYDGIPLDKNYAANTLAYISMLWNKRPVLLDTVLDDMPVYITYNSATHTATASLKE